MLLAAYSIAGRAPTVAVAGFALGVDDFAGLPRRLRELGVVRVSRMRHRDRVKRLLVLDIDRLGTRSIEERPRARDADEDLVQLRARLLLHAHRSLAGLAAGRFPRVRSPSVAVSQFVASVVMVSRTLAVVTGHL